MKPLPPRGGGERTRILLIQAVIPFRVVIVGATGRVGEVWIIRPQLHPPPAWLTPTEVFERLTLSRRLPPFDPLPPTQPQHPGVRVELEFFKTLGRSPEGVLIGELVAWRPDH